MGLIYRHGPWRGLDDVEFATLGYLDWFNPPPPPRRHPRWPDFTTPAAIENQHYRHTVAAPEAATQ